MRILKAGLLYFGVVFVAGFVCGLFREMALTPIYGRTTAIILEAPFMLIAMITGAWIAVHRKSTGWSNSALFLIGIVGFALMQIAEFGVGLGLRGMNFQDQITYFRTPAGQIYLGLLAIFIVMPLGLSAIPAIRKGGNKEDTRAEGI
jgi:hypothetical protein